MGWTSSVPDPCRSIKSGLKRGQCQVRDHPLPEYIKHLHVLSFLSEHIPFLCSKLASIILRVGSPRQELSGFPLDFLGSQVLLSIS